MKTKQDNDVIDCISVFSPKTKLGCHYQSDWLSSMMKTRQDNDVTDHTGAIYVENNIELSWPIESGVVYDKNQIR